jgi:putative FmdB family regulatory protein
MQGSFCQKIAGIILIQIKGIDSQECNDKYNTNSPQYKKTGVSMPIFEFKCTNCGEFIEVLVMGSSGDEEEIRCPKCDSQSFERVLSVSNHSMGGSVSSSSNGTSSGSSSYTQTRTCSSGSCTTYSIPGK